MIYLDNAATSFPKAPGVNKAVLETLNSAYGNANRSSHQAAINTTMLLLETREFLADLLGIKYEDRIAFTLNCTMALNMAIQGTVERGMRVLTSPIEHNSVMRILRDYEQRGNIELDIFDLDNNFQPDWNSFDKAIESKPDLLVVTAGSNVIGNIMPLDIIISKAKSIRCRVIVDGAQAVGHIPISVDELGADVFCFPGHKGLLGPTGTGAIYVSPNTELRPILFGGTGSVSDDELQPDFYPDLLESGTHNIHGIAGLKRATEFLLSEGIDSIREKKLKLMKLLYNGIEAIDGIRIYSTKPEENLGIISIVPDKGTIADLTSYLDRNDIAVRMGLHCAPSAHKTMKTFSGGGTVRLSPGPFTTETEITKTLEIIERYIRS